jgi:hypothetical protein
MVSAKETLYRKGKRHLFIFVPRQEGLRTMKLGIPHRPATLSISPRKNNVDLGRNGQSWFTLNLVTTWSLRRKSFLEKDKTFFYFATIAAF